MLYISDLLKSRYPSVAGCLKQVTEIGTITGTKDIWARDFMPIRNTLKDYRFEVEILPCSAHKNRTYQSAQGIYMNYVVHESNLLVPVFGQKSDEVAVERLSSLYPTHSITPVECNELAKEGGLLHCISWER